MSAEKVRPVRLEVMNEVVYRALLAGDLLAAGSEMGLELPAFLLERPDHFAMRLDQVIAGPDVAPWLVRAIVRNEDNIVVGNCGFHGPPDENGMVEIGYSIGPEFRRQGYGRACAVELIAYASERPEVHVVRASISPDNEASLRIVKSLRFQHVGEQWDEEDGLEHIYELPRENWGEALT